MKKLIIKILFIYLIIIIIIFSIKKIEKFSDDTGDILYIAENILNFSIKNYITPEMLDFILGSLKKNNNIPNYLLDYTLKNYATIYIDPYVNYYLLNNKENTTLYNKKGYFVYISNAFLKPDECAWDLGNKIIGYLCISDYYFISAIIKGHRIDISTVTLIRISPDDLISKDDFFKKHKLDCIITYIIPDSNYISILENKQLYVTGFKDMDINRIRAFYPFVKYDTVSLRSLFTNKTTSIVTYTDNEDYKNEIEILIPSMNYNIIENIPIIKSDEDTYKNIEKFITRIDLSKDAYDPKYFCYGDHNINNKFQCNSPYDNENNVKKKYNFWDKICSSDEDCPFFNNITGKGGCTLQNTSNYAYKEIGYCNFPVGIKRIGFTKYSSDGMFAPFCYDCEDPTDINCCSKQKNPDYVFPNDFEDREKLDKSTVVSRFDYII
jgi:hypothetical protein